MESHVPTTTSWAISSPGPRFHPHAHDFIVGYFIFRATVASWAISPTISSWAISPTVAPWAVSCPEGVVLSALRGGHGLRIRIYDNSHAANMIEQWLVNDVLDGLQFESLGKG
jgi:hypothetical protein